MKKVVRILGLCALVSLAFTACKKDNTQKVSFTASITQPTSNSRTHAVGYGHHLVWDAGDAIKVFNNAGTDMDFALPSTGEFAQQATFDVVGVDEVNFLKDLTIDDAYTSFYPNAVVEGSQVKMVIPANQEYVPQKNFDNNLYPMYAHNQGDNFIFHSNAGFLNVSVTCPQALSGTISITQIVLTSKDTNDKLNGEVFYDKDGSNYSFVGGTNVITMVPVAPAVLDWQMARDFTFVLPEGALYSGFDVDIYLDNGEVKTFEAPADVNTIEAETYTVMIPVTVGNTLQIVH